MTDRAISAEYLLYACDDDFELAEKISRRLNGLKLQFSPLQMNRLKAQKLLLKGVSTREVADRLDMQHRTVQNIRQKIITEGLTYYVGDDE